MSASGDLNSILSSALSQFRGKGQEKKNQKDAGGNGLSIPPLTAAKALVIAGLLGDALVVNSVLVNRDQVVEIVLTGSLRQKTQLEKILDQIGEMPFDEVVRAIVDRL